MGNWAEKTQGSQNDCWLSQNCSAELNLKRYEKTANTTVIGDNFQSPSLSLTSFKAESEGEQSFELSLLDQNLQRKWKNPRTKFKVAQYGAAYAGRPIASEEVDAGADCTAEHLGREGLGRICVESVCVVGSEGLEAGAMWN